MSDSHGKNQLIDKIVNDNSDADRFFHCGDIECDEFVYPDIITVSGNNDYYGDFPERIKFKLGTHQVLMLHSHTCYSFDRLKAISKMAKEEECDTVFFGHTHVACDTIVDGVRLINPGSLYYARDMRPISYCVINVDDDLHVEFRFAPFN